MDDRSAPSCHLTPARDSRFFQPGNPEQSSPNKEFKTLKSPSWVHEIFALFESSNRAVIWIRDEDCFIHDWNTERPRDYCFEFKWTVMRQGKAADLYVCSKSVNGAINCLGYLFELQMETTMPGSSSFLAITCLGPPPIDVFHLFALEEERICPLHCGILEKYILQNQKGSCGFQGMTFTASQCKTLATSGKQTHLVFDKCRFENRFEDDGQKAFVEALPSIDNQQSGSVKVEFKSWITLDDTNLIACLAKIKELRLEAPTNLTEEMCLAVVSAELDCLGLSRLKLNGAEQILIKNIREGRGPRGVSLDSSVFSSRDQFLKFCTALSDQEHLQSLELSEINRFGESNLRVEKALLAAWQGQKGRLTTFGLSNSRITETFWSSFLHQICMKPDLRKLSFANVEIQDSTVTREERTRHLSEVILANKRILHVSFCGTLFDKTVWQQCVIPALAHNEHRDHFAKVARIIERQQRKAILTGALSKVNDRPSLIYALLHQNLDVIADSVLERNNDQNLDVIADSVLERKVILAEALNRVSILQNVDVTPVADSRGGKRRESSTGQRKKPRVLASVLPNG